MYKCARTNRVALMLLLVLRNAFARYAVTAQPVPLLRSELFHMPNPFPPFHHRRECDSSNSSQVAFALD